MEIYRPLQLSFNNQVLEHNRKFYFVASATLGINLQTGEELLDVDYLKDIFECMGEKPFPDMGMPKPNGEYLVSGNFFSPLNKPVTGGEVKVKLNDLEKKLYIFGQRKWAYGLPSEPEEITTLPLDYNMAFGSENYKKNPDGMGYGDGLLPCIEDPRNLVSSKNSTPEPAGFTTLYPMLPQRTKYQGTYGSDYVDKYFPGHPKDLDYRFFLCAPSDQWIKGFFNGDENFELYNMHPDFPKIKGQFPGLKPRFFINRKSDIDEMFGELPLNLDTIWFFPEKMTGLQIFRGVVEVNDDEALEIKHVLAAYEDSSKPTRSYEYYKTAFERRKDGGDDLLKNMNTQDLIPDGHKCAMELLVGMALSEAGGEVNELAQNLEAKAAAVEKDAYEKIEEELKKADDNLKKTDIEIPDDTKERVLDKDGKLDLDKLTKSKSDESVDPDIEKLNKKIESIMPGITEGDPEKLDLKNFSFDKIDEMTEAIKELSEKKESDAKILAEEEIGKAKVNIEKQIDQIEKEQLETDDKEQVKFLDEQKKDLQENLNALGGILSGSEKAKAPLPRIDSEELKRNMHSFDPHVTNAIEHVESVKSMGFYDEKTKDLEKMIQKTVDESTSEVEEGLKEAEKMFKESYLIGAHFMEESLSPHKDSVDIIKGKFLALVSKGEDVSNCDWACIDLSDENLDGINLSGAYLEQVNFRGATLKGADLSGANLARADLQDADLTGANLENSNIGAVYALHANFSEANLKKAKLSKSNFTGANFANANLEEVETLEINIKNVNFNGAYIPKVNFIEISFSGSTFLNAVMKQSVLIKCKIMDCDFSDSSMVMSAFIDTDFINVKFNEADLSNCCFLTIEPEKLQLKNLTFEKACLKQVNFQFMNLKETVFAEADLENAFFGEADLTNADLKNTYAKNAQFRKAILTGANLNNIDLKEGSLAKSNLVNASFKGANLYGVDFLRSTITNTDFSDSNLDSTIIKDWRPA
ncbi:MAG: DUF2169 domain-containing protein [Desulfobacterales bacterium]|nr:DUF2169 domain-containing protein [Desulfobacterales bacterium]